MVKLMMVIIAWLVGQLLARFLVGRRKVCHIFVLIIRLLIRRLYSCQVSQKFRIGRLATVL